MGLLAAPPRKLAKLNVITEGPNVNCLDESASADAPKNYDLVINNNNNNNREQQYEEVKEYFENSQTFLNPLIGSCTSENSPPFIHR